MKTLITLAFLSLFISCGINDKTDISEDTNQKPKEFSTFLNQFPSIELPIKINGCEISPDTLKFLKSNNFNQWIDSDCFAIGKFNINSNFIGIITLGLADCLLPEIRTYSKKGKLINQETIAIGYCGLAPCYDCSEFMSLDENLFLYTSDTIIEAECNDDYEPITGTEVSKVIFKKGNISSEGSIEISEEKLIHLKM